MEKKKKSSSLIFNLFQKFREPKPEASEEAEIAVQPEPEPVIDVPIAEAPPHSPSPNPEEKETGTKTPFDSLFKYYNQYSERYDLSINPIADINTLSEWILSPIHKFTLMQNRKPEIQDVLDEICVLADRLWEARQTEEAQYEEALQKYYTELNMRDTSDSTAKRITEPNPLPSINAYPQLAPLPDKMASLLFIFPPARGGGEITVEQLRKLLSDKKIIYGIDESLIYEITENSRYLQLFLIAEGLPLIPSKDGYIEHHFNRDVSPKISQNEQGIADFRNINMFQTISAGDVICDFYPAEKGAIGYNIYKTPLLPKPPAVPAVPKGKNTALSEDQSKLMSVCDGHISFKGNQYSVEPVLQIKENVDYSVGNIDFPGDVIINGDVLSGFTIKAEGDILIKGMAESAFLFSEGNITIMKGMNGNSTGTIDAKGDIKSSFLENCTVHACGCVHSNTIIACEVHSEDSVYAQGSQGVIIGGTVTVLNGVEARMIGSKSLRKTTIVLGELPRILTNKNALKLEQVETKTILDKLSVNISYLDKFKASLPPEKLSVLEQLNEQFNLYQSKKQRLDKELQAFENIAPDFSKCYVKSNMIFPFTQIHIGGEFLMVNEVISKSHIFLGGDGIHQGTF